MTGRNPERMAGKLEGNLIEPVLYKVGTLRPWLMAPYLNTRHSFSGRRWKAPNEEAPAHTGGAMGPEDAAGAARSIAIQKRITFFRCAQRVKRRAGQRRTISYEQE